MQSEWSGRWAPDVEVMVPDLIVAIAIRREAASIAHGEPGTPITTLGWALGDGERGAAADVTAAGLRDRRARRGGAVDEHHGTQCEPWPERGMNDEVTLRECAETGRDGERLERKERAVVLAMRIERTRGAKGGADDALGVALEGIGIRRERWIAQRSHERVPQRARVADQVSNRRSIRKHGPARQPRERTRIERVREIEARCSE